MEWCFLLVPCSLLSRLRGMTLTILMPFDSLSLSHSLMVSSWFAVRSIALFATPWMTTPYLGLLALRPSYASLQLTFCSSHNSSTVLNCRRSWSFLIGLMPWTFGLDVRFAMLIACWHLAVISLGYCSESSFLASSLTSLVDNVNWYWARSLFASSACLRFMVRA